MQPAPPASVPAPVAAPVPVPVPVPVAPPAAVAAAPVPAPATVAVVEPAPVERPEMQSPAPPVAAPTPVASAPPVVEPVPAPSVEPEAVPAPALVAEPAPTEPTVLGTAAPSPLEQVLPPALTLPPGTLLSGAVLHVTSGGHSVTTVFRGTPVAHRPHQTPHQSRGTTSKQTRTGHRAVRPPSGSSLPAVAATAGQGDGSTIFIAALVLLAAVAAAAVVGVLVRRACRPAPVVPPVRLHAVPSAAHDAEQERIAA